MFSSFFNFLRSGLRAQVRAITVTAIRSGVQDALGDIQRELLGNPLAPPEPPDQVDWTGSGKSKLSLQQQAWLLGVSHQGTVDDIKGRISDSANS